MMLASSPRQFSRTLRRLAKPFVQVHGEGAGGWVTPPPRGRRRGGRGNSLKHRRPEGWWDWMDG
eukprot:7781970-Pyramimonas_sp.AAC.1